MIKLQNAISTNLKVKVRRKILQLIILTMSLNNKNYKTNLNALLNIFDNYFIIRVILQLFRQLRDLEAVETQ